MPSEDLRDASDPTHDVIHRVLRKGGQRVVKSSTSESGNGTSERIPLGKFSTVNEGIPIRRSSRLASLSTRTCEGTITNVKKKRYFSTDDENFPHQPAKRLKSITERESNDSQVFTESVVLEKAGIPIVRARRPVASLRKSQNQSQGPLTDEKTIAISEEEVVPLRRSARRAPHSPAVVEASKGKKKRGLSIIDGENVNPQRAKSLKATSGKDIDNPDIIAFKGSPVKNKYGHQIKKAAGNLGGALIKSIDQITEGSVIQADIRVAQGDKTPLVMTAAMKVMAPGGDIVSFERATAVTKAGMKIPKQCDCCPSGVLSIRFSDLIGPRFLDEARFQTLLDSPNSTDVGFFD